jgi:hypothetical protein
VSRYQHAASAVDTVLYEDKIKVAWVLVLVYTMEATLLRRAAQAIAVWHKTGILRGIRRRPEEGRNHLAHQEAKEQHVTDEGYKETTYRFLPLISLSSIDRIVVFGNVQMQIVLIRKVLVTLAASVHVDLLIVHIVVFNRSEGQRLVRRQ